MKNTCEDVRELLSALVDDELDAQSRKFVSAHLLNCPDCAHEAGRMFGASRLVQRDATDADVPAGFGERLSRRLDEIDGVRRHVRSIPAVRRLVGIAAVGAIAISLAIILSTVFFMNADHALELSNAHFQLAGITGPLAPDGVTAVSCNPFTQHWEQSRSAIVQIDGQMVTWTLYEVGSCPVSVFQGPAEWHPYRTGWLVSENIGGFEVREVGDNSMTSWTEGDTRFVIVAMGGPERVADLAAAWVNRHRARSL